MVLIELLMLLMTWFIEFDIWLQAILLLFMLCDLNYAVMNCWFNLMNYMITWDTLLHCAYGGGEHGSREHCEDHWNLNPIFDDRKERMWIFLVWFHSKGPGKFCCSTELYCEELGLPTSCIIIGSQLPRGSWETWIDKRMNLARLVQLSWGGRYTRRPETSLSKTGDICEKRSRTQDWN